MNWRKSVEGGKHYQNSSPEIAGGDRVCAIWDEFSLSMLDAQLISVSGDFTVTIDTAGTMTIS